MPFANAPHCVRLTTHNQIKIKLKIFNVVYSVLWLRGVKSSFRCEMQPQIAVLRTDSSCNTVFRTETASLTEQNKGKAERESERKVAKIKMGYECNSKQLTHNSDALSLIFKWIKHPIKILYLYLLVVWVCASSRARISIENENRNDCTLRTVLCIALFHIPWNKLCLTIFSIDNAVALNSVQAKRKELRRRRKRKAHLLPSTEKWSVFSDANMQ